MRKVTIRALVASAITLPLLALAVGLAAPKSRAFLASFVAPPPSPAAAQRGDGGSFLLPSAGGPAGAESVELRTLFQDSTTRTSAVTPVGGPLLAPAGSPTEEFKRPSRLRRPDVMTRDDPTIDRATAFLLSDPKGRIAFREALTRSGRWSAEVTRVFDIWKIPHAWLALALIQSGFQPSAASDTGGAGIWQLTPDVAHVYGLAMLPTYDERKAVAASTEATARYLGDLYARFGSWELAILAFRWGYRTTLSELQKNASTDFWQLVPRLDDQAVRFVSRVFATARILENLDLLSLDSIRRDAPANTSDLDVSPGTPFALIARAARIDVALLRELNPEFSSDSVPQANFTINVRVPSDTLTSARSRLPGLLRGTTDETEPPSVPTTKDVDPNTHHAITRGSQRRELYTTKEGDTLDSLSRRYHIPLDVLASDNARDPTSSLNPGTIIAIRVENAPPIPSSAPPARRKKTH